jgi:uncharacterized membrane protein YwzB
MMLKFLVYILSAFIVIYSLDSVNMNVIFKKNKVVQARVFYIIVALVLTYLLANFIYDFVYIKLF